MKAKVLARTFILIIFIFSFTYSCDKEEDEVFEEDVEEVVVVNNSSFKATWVRTIGASGDRTDIAIGGIANEASNRVYMCEYKGSVGLYKGYLDGNTITWDTTYGLPNSSIRMVGNQLELSYPSVSWSIPTLYDKGTWSGNCGSISGGSTSTTGKVLFWTQSDQGCGNITVTVSGSSGIISQFYSSATPDCGATGCANFTLPAGTYNFSASCSSKTWSGTVSVTANGCFRMRLY